MPTYIVALAIIGRSRDLVITGSADVYRLLRLTRVRLVSLYDTENINGFTITVCGYFPRISVLKVKTCHRRS